MRLYILPSSFRKQKGLSPMSGAENSLEINLKQITNQQQIQNQCQLLQLFPVLVMFPSQKM